MKKFLYGTTALVAAGMIASPAAAAEKIQLKLGGFMEQWIGFASQESAWETANGTNYREFDSQSDSEVYFTGSTKLDNGITVSVIIQLEADESVGAIDESYLKLTSDSIGDLRIGGRKSANWAFGFFAPDVGIGLDSGDTENWILVPSAVTGEVRTRIGVADKNGIIYYTPSFGGFRVGASYHPNYSTSTQGKGIADQMSAGNQSAHEIGAAYQGDFNSVSIKATGFWGQKYGAEGASDINEWRLGVLVGFGGFSIGGGYKNIDDSATSTSAVTSSDGYIWNVGVSYGSGPFAVSAAYQETRAEGLTSDPDDDEKTTVIGSVKYNLGPGVDVRGSVFWAEYKDETTAASANNEGVGGVVGLTLGF